MKTRLALGVLVLLVAALAGPTTADASRCRGSHWVGTWGAAPALAGPSYTDRTVRFVLNPHRGGRVVRLRLSNRFGSGPLTIDRVTVARRSSGAGVVAKTLRPVRFGGLRSVTIPRGADVLSDAARLRMRAFGDVSVSMYLRGPTGTTTMHAVANETGSYSASGDLVGIASGEGFGPPAQAWPLLTGVEVQAPRRVGTLVALGDSITDGFQSTAAQRRGQRNTRWPDFLARRLASRDRPFSVVNSGISGNRLRVDGLNPVYGPNALSRLDSDVVAVPGATTAIVLEGINDLGQPPPAAPAEVIASLRQVILRLHLAGLRVLVGTLTPSGGHATPTYGSAEANARRQAVNRWIRKRGVPDGVVDFDAAIRDPRKHSRLRPAYDSGDHLHPNARGYARMGAAVPLSLLGAPRCA